MLEIEEKITFSEVASDDFYDALMKARNKNGNVRKHVPLRMMAYYEEASCFLSADSLTGFAIGKFENEGELFSVFNVGGKGRGKEAVKRAIELGAKWLECAEGFLVEYYKSFGFSTAQIFYRMEL